MKSKLISLVVCATLFGTATHVQASTIVGGNGLLSASGANQIETWLANTPLYSGSLQFTNVFTAVPEPSTWAMMIWALLASVSWRIAVRAKAIALSAA